jgi:hypothetical protein
MGGRDPELPHGYTIPGSRDNRFWQCSILA